MSTPKSNLASLFIGNSFLLCCETFLSCHISEEHGKPSGKFNIASPLNQGFMLCRSDSQAQNIASYRVIFSLPYEKINYFEKAPISSELRKIQDFQRHHEL